MDNPSDAEKWSVDQERVFLENLMQTRFNFFLVVFGLWMVTVAHITTKLPKLLFLGLGIVICSLLWLTIRRICKKVIAALDLLGADPKHPMKQVALAAGEDWFIRFIPVTSNQVIGYIIPVFCISLFFLWFLYIAMSPAEKRVHIRTRIADGSQRFNQPRSPTPEQSPTPTPTAAPVMKAIPIATPTLTPSPSPQPTRAPYRHPRRHR